MQACEGTSKKREGILFFFQILLLTKHKYASLWGYPKSEGILFFFKFSSSHNTSMQVCESVNCDQGWVAVSIVLCHDTDALELDTLSSFLFWAFLDVFMKYGTVLPSPSSRPLQLDWLSKLSASWRCSINSTASHSGAINHAGFEFYSIYSVIIINICICKINNRERTFADKVADSIVQCHSAVALSRRIWHSLITKCQVFSICGPKFHFWASVEGVQ